MGTIIDGKQLSFNIRQEVKASVATLQEKYGRTPCLCVILVGDNSASQVYVRNKKKACEEVGIKSVGYELPESTTEAELLDLIDKLNKDIEIDGILVQLPLPKHIDSQKVLVSIDPDKDVDGFHPVNVGRLVTGVSGFVPCTPAGIIELIKFAGVDITGKNAVVCGRSNIVGKPVAILLTKENATVTITHTKTINTDEILRNADIVVAAIGVARHFKKESFKKGACVIDVGMNRDEDGKLCGDVDFDDVFDTVGPITPVPGGVGPMTITMLLKNTISSFEMHNK